MATAVRQYAVAKKKWLAAVAECPYGAGITHAYRQLCIIDREFILSYHKILIVVFILVVRCFFAIDERTSILIFFSAVFV